MRSKREIREKVDPKRNAKAILYCRVSSEHQKRSGLGIEDQQARLTVWAEQNGITDFVILRDEAETGKNTDRPEFQRALEMLAEGHRNMLVALKLDRIGRSTQDVLDLRRRAKDQGWHIAVLDGNIQFDTRSPHGKLVLTMFAAIAEWEADMIAERTRDALAQKKRAASPGVISQALEDRIVSLVRVHGLLGTAKVLNDDGTPTSRGGASWHAGTVRRVVERYERATRS